MYANTPEAREDLIQEILYQLWKSFPGFRQASSLSTWIYRVAINTAIYQLKRHKKRPAITSWDEGMDETLSEEEAHSTNDYWQELHRRIGHLSLLEKSLILLYLEGQSHAEIADITGLTVSNVGTRLSRIRQKLKAM